MMNYAKSLLDRPGGLNGEAFQEACEESSKEKDCSAAIHKRRH
jgi:hypothetical protein